MWDRVKTYVVGTLKNCRNETIIFNTHNIVLELIIREMLCEKLFSLFLIYDSGLLLSQHEHFRLFPNRESGVNNFAQELQRHEINVSLFS